MFMLHPEYNIPTMVVRLKKGSVCVPLMGLEKDRCMEGLKKTARSNMKQFTNLSSKITILFDHYVSFSVSVMVTALLVS